MAEKEEHFLSLTNGYFPTELSDPLQRPSEGLEESMGKLQREMTMRSQRLLEAEDEEDKAREVSMSVFADRRYEEAATSSLSPQLLCPTSVLSLPSNLCRGVYPPSISHSPTPSSYNSLYS